MMKSKLEIKKTWHLVLDEKEAEMLRGLFQNPLFEDETFREKEFRSKIFNALTESPSKVDKKNLKDIDDIPY